MTFANAAPSFPLPLSLRPQFKSFPSEVFPWFHWQGEMPLPAHNSGTQSCLSVLKHLTLWPFTNVCLLTQKYHTDIIWHNATYANNPYLKIQPHVKFMELNFSSVDTPMLLALRSRHGPWLPPRSSTFQGLYLPGSEAAAVLISDTHVHFHF